MELYNIKYVLAIAEFGNLSSAAAACHVSQPTLSQQLSKLEKELGISLFFRTPRGVTLTEAGEAFVRSAREIVQKSEALEAEMASFAGLKKGTLGLGTITSLRCIDFGGLLSAFCEKYPDVSVNIMQGGTYPLIDMVDDHRIDTAIISIPRSGVPHGFECIKLSEDYYCVAVPAGHRLAKKKELSLKDLQGEKMICHPSTTVAADLINDACESAGFFPNATCISYSPTTTISMVRGGMGIALLPSEEFISQSREGVKKLLLKEKITKEVGIVWKKDAASLLVSIFVEFAKNWTHS